MVDIREDGNGPINNIEESLIFYARLRGFLLRTPQVGSVVINRRQGRTVYTKSVAFMQDHNFLLLTASMIS